GFRLDGTAPVWTFAWGDVALEKRIFMEPGANTTYARYRLLRAPVPVTLELRVLVNYRDYHATTRGAGWQMRVSPVEGGVRIEACAGAGRLTIQGRLGAPIGAAAASRAGAGAVPPAALLPVEARPAHTWYYGFLLAREEERGLDAQDDHLHAATIRGTLV